MLQWCSGRVAAMSVGWKCFVRCYDRLFTRTLGEVRKKGRELGFPLTHANVLVLFFFACDLCPEMPFPEAVQRGAMLSIQAPALLLGLHMNISQS